MKSALFIDFDNVYSGLRKLDPTIADRFARKSQRWMPWLVEALALPEPVAKDAHRRILVRRCYLNPQVYQRYRPAFNLAGFEIIDCPSLTSEGKTSTDQRVLAAAALALVRKVLVDATGPVALAKVASTILNNIDGMDASTWAGYGSFRDLMASWDLAPLQVSWEGGGQIFDPRQHTAVTAASNDAPTAGDALASIVALIKADLAEHPFDLKETGIRVRDAARATDHPVKRADVNWILRGLLLRGHAFGSGDDGVGTLGRVTAENLRALCVREQLTIDLDVDEVLDRWINPGGE